MLARRMAENYLPVAALRSWLDGLPASHRARKRAHVDEYAQLASERRHHHHLKRGLRPTELHHYGELSAEAEERLRFSLGDNLWSAFRDARPVDLRAEGVHAELASFFRQVLRQI